MRTWLRMNRPRSADFSPQEATPAQGRPCGLKPALLNGSWPGSKSDGNGTLSRRCSTGAQTRRQSQRGFATVIVLALIFVMISLLLANNRVLYLLKQDLQRIEAQQTRRAADPKPTPITRPRPEVAPSTFEDDAAAPEASEPPDPARDP